MRIAFVVGDVVNTSGGSNVIIEYAAALERRGHEVHLFTQEPYDATAAAWHPRLPRLRVRHVGEASDEPFDFAFATWWFSYFDLSRLPSRVYGYLNQSLESRFHSEERFKVLNRCTYSLPLLFVTEARWLAEFIRMVQPAGRTVYLRNGLSEEYFPRAAAPPERKGPLRVLVEGPWPVPFKGVPETFEVLREARAQGVRFELGWLTIDAGEGRSAVRDLQVTIHERIPIDKVRDVLREYDVLVKLSRVEGMYGPPLEMFSQGGTAITYNVTGSDEYMVHGENGLLVEPHNRRQIVRYLELLDRRPAYLARLRRNALATAQAYPGWEASGDELARALQTIAAEGFTNAEVRPALAAMSTLQTRWLEDARRLEVLDGPLAWLLDRVHRLKASRPYGLAKTMLPPAVRQRIRARVSQVLR